MVHKLIFAIFLGSGRWLDQRPQFVGLFFFHPVSYAKINLQLRISNITVFWEILLIEN
jgi:hypothetical protein